LKANLFRSDFFLVICPNTTTCELECPKESHNAGANVATLTCKGKNKWYKKGVEFTSLVEENLKKQCNTKDYCMKLPDLKGVSVECFGGNDLTTGGDDLDKDKVANKDYCNLNCETEGLKIVKEYKTLICVEVDSKLRFQTVDKETIDIKNISNLELCPGIYLVYICAFLLLCNRRTKF
jgi:hypothetical protein